MKLRGYRIELGDIESALRQSPAIREAVVLPRQDAAGDQRLVAFVSLNEAQTAQELNAHVRSFLKDRLPKYMLPNDYVTLDAMPLSPNGKIDRNALRALGRRLGRRPNATDSRTAESTSLLHQGRELRAQRGDLGPVVDQDVGIVGVARHVVLVVGLGGIERAQRHDLGDDRRAERVRAVRLRDLGLRGALLRLVRRRRSPSGTACRRRGLGG